jgi:hypothetical protein
MNSEVTQTVFLDDGRYAKVTFAAAGRGRIRILRILVSEEEDEVDESAWIKIRKDDLDRDELKYIIRQLDLSELELDF